jgi:hypothetical protein
MHENTCFELPIGGHNYGMMLLQQFCAMIIATNILVSECHTYRCPCLFFYPFFYLKYKKLWVIIIPLCFLNTHDSHVILKVYFPNKKLNNYLKRIKGVLCLISHYFLTFSLWPTEWPCFNVYKKYCSHSMHMIIFSLAFPYHS